MCITAPYIFSSAGADLYLPPLLVCCLLELRAESGVGHVTQAPHASLESLDE